MANETNKTTEILEFKVQQGDAITEMERLKKTMLGLKEDQKALNDAYKKGAITQEEYAKELVRVEAISKKTGAAYNDLQKKVTGVQTETSKLIQSMKDAAGQINVAGVNVGSLSSKLASLANPVTATVAVIGALGAAYARSTIGAKDLAFASSQLSNAITIVTNDFARLISSSEDGEGTLSKLTNQSIRFFGTMTGPLGLVAQGYFDKVATSSRDAALAQEELEDLMREEITIRGEISERLSDNQELLTSINDEQTTYQQKLLNISDIIGNLRNNQRELLEVEEKELVALQRRLDKDTTNEELQTAVLNKTKEISKTKSDTEKKIQAILRLEDNVKQQNEQQEKAEKEKTKQKKFQTSELERQARIATRDREDRADPRSEIQKFQDDTAVKVKTVTNANKAMADAQDALTERVEKSNKKQKQTNEDLLKSEESRRDALRLFSSEAGRLFQTIDKDNRALAAAQLAVDAGLTISGITKNSAQLPPKQAALYRAAAILSAGASLAQAAKLMGASSPNLGSASGGGGGSNILSTVISGASIGAALGSIIPGIGTVVGGAVGGAIGFVRSLFGKRGYAEGGYTGPGTKYQPVGVVHAGEVVWSQKDVARVGGPRVADAMRPTYKGYADGGLATAPNLGITATDVLRIVESMPPVVLVQSEYDNFIAQRNRKIQYTER